MTPLQSNPSPFRIANSHLHIKQVTLTQIYVPPSPKIFVLYHTYTSYSSSKDLPSATNWSISSNCKKRTNKKDILITLYHIISKNFQYFSYHSTTSPKIPYISKLPQYFLHKTTTSTINKVMFTLQITFLIKTFHPSSNVHIVTLMHACIHSLHCSTISTHCGHFSKVMFTISITHFTHSLHTIQPFTQTFPQLPHNKHTINKVMFALQITFLIKTFHPSTDVHIVTLMHALNLYTVQPFPHIVDTFQK